MNLRDIVINYLTDNEKGMQPFINKNIFIKTIFCMH